MASSSSSSPEYAGFWVRLGAVVIDALVVQVVAFPFYALAVGTRLLQFDPDALAWNVLPPALLAVVIVAFWSAFGATPGKLAMGLRIVDAKTGGRVPTWRLALRLAGYFVSGALLDLGFLWIAVDRRKQGWHDKIASTVVIHEPV